MMKRLLAGLVSAVVVGASVSALGSSQSFTFSNASSSQSFKLNGFKSPTLTLNVTPASAKFKLMHEKGAMPDQEIDSNLHDGSTFNNPCSGGTNGDWTFHLSTESGKYSGVVTISGS